MIGRYFNHTTRFHYRMTLLGMVLVMLMVSGCELNRLKSAEELYYENRYVAALQQLDHFIDITGNGALKTEAELYRSMSYLELGKLAEQRQSIDIAISFFKLANSSEADERLAEIYKAKADKYLSEDNIDQAMENYTNIWLEILYCPCRVISL